MERASTAALADSIAVAFLPSGTFYAVTSKKIVAAGRLPASMHPK